MIVGILQFELIIHHAESLKDKRRVVMSVKDRLHREHQVSVAEVDRQENPRVAVLGLAIVGSDAKYIGDVLSNITLKLRALHDAELGDVTREILRGHAGEVQRGHRIEDDAEQDGLAPTADEAMKQMLTEMATRAESAMTELNSSDSQGGGR
ncbi:MAG: DUF503 family protein [Planctomycetes bacterium]|nr:DUF503 family protein [Planctomycetota bacterium]